MRARSFIPFLGADISFWRDAMKWYHSQWVTLLVFVGLVTVCAVAFFYVFRYIVHIFSQSTLGDYEAGAGALLGSICCMNFLERSTTTLLHPRRTTGDRYDTVAEIVHSLQNRISVLYAELESKHTIATSKIKKEMQSIVDTNQQLLHLARIGSGMYERDRVQLSSIIAREVEEFQWKCDMEHIELTSIIEREVVCMGNAVLLAELVRLLVHNACKYRSPERSAVVCVLLRSSPRVTFEVIDNGIGIPEEDVPRVFEKWFRSSFVVERYEGTGLGLAVAHQIVTFHKGTITVQSTWGNGTRVCVTL